MEASANRSAKKARLSRVRAGEVPAATLDIDKRLSQKELFPLLQLLRLVKIEITYFEKYANKYITAYFYANKPNPPYWKVPENESTDDIIYDKFTIDFAGYEGIDF